MTSKELLRRIDKRDYLTEREHHQFVTELKHELQRLEKQDKILDILKRKIKVYPNGVIYLEDMSYEECVKIKELIK